MDCANETLINLKLMVYVCICVASNGIDTACTEPSQCTPFGAAFCPGLEVFPRRCQCHAYADYDAKQELCVPKKGKWSNMLLKAKNVI